MKKYFLKGKQYLSKKLEEFDIETANIDFVNEQLPNRLKEPLNLLRHNQIDLEDSQLYEPYFKNYPNHHLSHFLLDKYRMLDEANSETPQYLPPSNKNNFIPPFDEKLEKKALMLKQAIQQYDEGFNKTDDPVICICVIHFHHKRGTEIEYRFPKNKAVEGIENMIIHHAMPDSSHNKHEDYNFFNFQSNINGKNRMLFGVSYFKQIKLTEEMKKNNVELTRSYLQKAVAIVSTLPMFGYLKMRLSITTKLFFEQFTNFDIIELAYKDINRHLAQTWPQMQLTDLYIGSDLKVIIDLFGAAQFYQIWKAVLYQRRIVVFAHSSSSASSFILSLISLFPGLNTFGIYSKPISKYMQSLREYALPLRLFSSENFLSMSFHIQDFHLLSKFMKNSQGNFLIGTTNRLLKQGNNDYGIQLLVNLENCTIEKGKSNKNWEPITKKQKTFIHELEQFVSKEKNIGYGGSQDCIRNHFHNFLKGALVELAQSIKLFHKFVADCDEYSKNQNLVTKDTIQKKSSYQQMHEEEDPTEQNKSVKTKNQFPPILPSEVSQMILPQLLMNKSFTYFLQFHNQKLPQIVKGKSFPSLYINNYDYFLRISEDEFISYNWLDKKLTFGHGSSLRNYDGKQIKFSKIANNSYDMQLTQKDKAKSIFIGIVENSKFNKNGFYVDENDHYQGQFLNGGKNGYGKYTSSHEKYIGYFQNNLYEGEGQLIVDNDIYVGEFKEGLRDGYGTNQGNVTFQGYWQNDKPVSQVQKNTSVDSKPASETNKILKQEQKSEQNNVQQIVKTEQKQEENNTEKSSQ